MVGEFLAATLVAALPDPVLVWGDIGVCPSESASSFGGLKSKKKPRAWIVGVPGDIGGVLIRLASYFISVSI